MAQLVDALALEAKCCRFESDLEHHFIADWLQEQAEQFAGLNVRQFAIFNMESLCTRLKHGSYSTCNENAQSRMKNEVDAMLEKMKMALINS